MRISQAELQAGYFYPAIHARLTESAKWASRGTSDEERSSESANVVGVFTNQAG
jgi:hypothetical protein